MKKIFILLVIFLVGELSFGNFVFSEYKPPSFERYYIVKEGEKCPLGFNCHPYPTLHNFKISEIEKDKKVVITADIIDVSGVLSASVIIKRPSGEKYTFPFQKIAKNSYFLSLDISNYPDDYYIVEVFVSDNLLNKHLYQNLGGFAKGDVGEWLWGWNFRKKITIDNSLLRTYLSDFPLYIKIEKDLEMAAALENGRDIRFTASDGKTVLKYERESWQGGGGVPVTAEFWVRVPIITASQENYIYIYYGNPEAEEGESKDEVWVRYNGVWHFSKIKNSYGDYEVDFSDSTLNNNDFVNQGSVSRNGKIGGGANLNYTSFFSRKKVRVTKDFPFVLEMWLYPRYESLGEEERVIISAGRSDLKQSISLFYNFKEEFFKCTFFSEEQKASNTFRKRGWYYLNFIYNEKKVQFFVNGKKELEWEVGPISNFENFIFVGVDPFSKTSYFNGIIDEMRILKFVPSEEWIEVSYLNMTEPKSLISFGEQESLLIRD